jgi:hypothetical protein
VAVAEDWKMIEELNGKSNRRDSRPNRMPKRDMVVKDGDTLTLGNQTLRFHQLPGHTPGVLMTEGITVYDGRTSYKAVVPAGAAGGPGLAGAEQGVRNANKLAAIQGVQVNLQIHSWAEPDGYPGGGVLERASLLKTRKPGAPIRLLTLSPGPSAPKPLKNLRRKPWRQNERKPQQQSSSPNSR